MCAFVCACVGLGAVVSQQLWSIYTLPIANTDVTALFKGKSKTSSVKKKKKKACVRCPFHISESVWLQPWSVRFNIPSCLAISCQKWPAGCYREANPYSEIYYTTNPPLQLLIKTKLQLSNDLLQGCHVLSVCCLSVGFLVVLVSWGGCNVDETNNKPALKAAALWRNFKSKRKAGRNSFNRNVLFNWNWAGADLLSRVEWDCTSLVRERQQYFIDNKVQW